MENLIEKLKQHKFQCSILYTYNFTVFGMILNVLGSAILELSEKMNLQATDFNVAFTIRGIGYMVGCYLGGYFDGKIDLHKIFSFGCMLTSFAAFTIQYSSSLFDILVNLFISGLGCGVFEALANQLILEANKGNIGHWMQVLHSGFGIGSIISPYLVAQFGVDTSFNIIGVFSAIQIIPLLILETPTSQPQQQQNQQRGSQILLQRNSIIQLEQHNNINSQLNTSNHLDLEKSHNHLSQQQQSSQQQLQEEEYDIPKNVLWLFSMVLALDVGIELGFGGWIPSYSKISAGLTDKQSAYASSLISFGLTFGRVVCIFLTSKLNPQKMLYISLYACSISTVLFILVPSNINTIYIYATALGIFISAVFPQLVSLPDFLKLYLNPADTSFMLVVGAAVGELVIPLMQGFLLEISSSLLIYSVLVVQIVSVFLLVIGINKSKAYIKQKQQSKEIQMKLLSHK